MLVETCASRVVFINANQQSGYANAKPPLFYVTVLQNLE